MKRALVAAIAAALTTAAVLSASGLGATTSRKAKSRTHHAHRAGATGATATGATGAWGAKPTGPPPTMAEVHAKMEAQRAAQQKKLADALGVSVEKLQSSLDAVEAKRLAADVAAKRLTQAQADAIKACKTAPLTCDRSNLPAFGGHGGPGGPRGMHRGPGRAGDLKALADELGVSTDKLRSALQATRPQGPGFGGHMDGGHGPHGGGMGGPPPGMGGGGGPQGGAFQGPPADAGTGV